MYIVQGIPMSKKTYRMRVVTRYLLKTQSGEDVIHTKIVLIGK